MVSLYNVVIFGSSILIVVLIILAMLFIAVILIIAIIVLVILFILILLSSCNCPGPREILRIISSTLK